MRTLILLVVVFAVLNAGAGDQVCKNPHVAKSEKKRSEPAKVGGEPVRRELPNRALTAEEIKHIQELAQGERKEQNSAAAFLLSRSGNRKPIQFFVYLHLELMRVGNRSIEHLFSKRWDEIKKMDFSFADAPPDLRRAWRRLAQKMVDRYESAELSARTEKLMLLPLLVLRRAPPDVMKENIRKIATRLSGYMVESELEGVYPPKVYQFAKQLIRKELGLSYVPLTDLVGVRDEGRIRFRILSIDPIAHGRGTQEGEWNITIAHVKTVRVPEDGRTGTILVNDEVLWKVGGRQFRGKMSVRLGPSMELIAPSNRTLEYASMWADRKLTGLILMDANMESFGTYVVNQYKSYYVENGYRSGGFEKVSDFKAFLKAEVGSGRLDYVFKEAHSGGSSDKVATVVNTGTVITLMKDLPGGKQEVVHLFYPSRSQNSEEVGYTEFADWMKDRRSARKNPQLFYVDTACFGLNTAAALVNAVGSNRLVVSGTKDSAETFTNDNETALLHILSGIRSGKSFPEIREELRKNVPSYRADENDRENSFRFPGEPTWRQSIHGSTEVSRSADIRTTVLDQDGRVVTIETLEQDSQAQADTATGRP